MSYFIRPSTLEVIVTGPGKAVEDPECLRIDPETALSCSDLLWDGQVLTTAQAEYLRQRRGDLFRQSAPVRETRPEPTTVTSTVAEQKDELPRRFPEDMEDDPIPNFAIWGWGLVAFGVWMWAAVSTVQEMNRADRGINRALSSDQVQQLNGQVSAHALMALIVALTATIPFVIAAALKDRTPRG